MHSADTIRHDADGWAVPDVAELLVLWQHPDSRQIIPIGRVCFDGERYQFDYTIAATRIPGFRPLPGLPDLYRTYESQALPRVMAARVMDSDRPDYAEYLHSIGLEAAHATPWEQIVHSGGSRAGDTLQFMQLPTVADGRARARFLVNGIRHIPSVTRLISGRRVLVTPAEHERALLDLRPGDSVLVEPEDNNARDSSAALVTSAGVPLGWVPRAMSAGVRQLLESGPVWTDVVRVGSESAPAHLRLVLDLDVAAPVGFEFDPDGLWRKVSTRAG